MDQADIFASMLGAAPTDRGSQMSIAEALRRQANHARMGMAAGGNLADAGASENAGVANVLKQLQSTRQMDTDNAQQKAFQTGQLKHLSNMEGITMRGQDMAYDPRMLAAMAKLNGGAGKNDALHERQATWLSQKLEQTGLSELQASIAGLRKTIKENTRPDGTVPGLGIGSRLPQWAQQYTDGPGAVSVRQGLEGLKNSILKSRSGLAVTEAEAQRFAREVGDDGLLSQADRLKALERIEKLAESRIQNLYAGVAPEALALYRARHGQGDVPTETDVPGDSAPSPYENMSLDDLKNEMRKRNLR